MPSIPAFGASPRPTVSIHLYGAIFTHEPNMHTESPAATGGIIQSPFARAADSADAALPPKSRTAVTR